ncbi:uncharacterized protein [Bemisia tabaci]|uniref:uncharacterized protein n=1 Tax=Bemisia tabaci TaxID=7038 RepID=UPI003B28B313
MVLLRLTLNPPLPSEPECGQECPECGQECPECGQECPECGQECPECLKEPSSNRLSLHLTHSRGGIIRAIANVNADRPQPARVSASAVENASSDTFSLCSHPFSPCGNWRSCCGQEWRGGCKGRGGRSTTSNSGAPKGAPQKVPLILMHKQALSNNGDFNFAFASDNGLKQGEKIHPDGSRTGAYSYVDPNGKTISVKYSAGKDGFRILEGDHVPKAIQVTSALPSSPYHSAEEGHGGQRSAPFVARTQLPFASTRTWTAGSWAHVAGLASSAEFLEGRHSSAKQAESDEDVHKGPHSFGSGYAFEFSAAGKAPRLTTLSKARASGSSGSSKFS